MPAELSKVPDGVFFVDKVMSASLFFKILFYICLNVALLSS